MALVKEREAMIEQLRSFVGELGDVIDDFDVIIGNAPSKKSLYSYYAAGANDDSLLEMEEVYQARLIDSKYWQMYIKRGGIWIKT